MTIKYQTHFTHFQSIESGEYERQVKLVAFTVIGTEFGIQFAVIGFYCMRKIHLNNVQEGFNFMQYCDLLMKQRSVERLHFVPILFFHSKKNLVKLIYQP